MAKQFLASESAMEFCRGFSSTLRLGDDRPRTAPTAVGLVDELGEYTRCLPGLLTERSGFQHLWCEDPPQTLVPRKAKA